MGLLGKVLDRDTPDVGRAAEAAATILLSRLALRLVRLEVLVELSRGLASAPGDTEGGTEALERVAWATNAAGAVLGATCLPRSLALQWMLARRGVASDLCLGFPREGPLLPGHAWVEVGAKPIGDGSVGTGDEPGTGPFELLCRLPRRGPDSASGGREPAS